MMTDDLALSRLMAWLSPVFPTGSFAYSSGLEAAVSDGLVQEKQSLRDWLEASLLHGRLINDAIFLMESHLACDDPDALAEINELALASSGSGELYLESTAQGAAFTEAMQSWREVPAPPLAVPFALQVAVGAACGAARIGARSAIIAYLHSYIANQLQIAIRLSVVGQTASADLLAHLEPAIVELASETEGKSLDDLGSATIMADMVTMRHETQHARMFRS